eukprot:165315-Chlamydomonas_euryale.AAC.3
MQRQCREPKQGDKAETMQRAKAGRQSRDNANSESRETKQRGLAKSHGSSTELTSTTPAPGLLPSPAMPCRAAPVLLTLRTLLALPTRVKRGGCCCQPGSPSCCGAGSRCCCWCGAPHGASRLVTVLTPKPCTCACTDVACPCTRYDSDASKSICSRRSTPIRMPASSPPPPPRPLAMYEPCCCCCLSVAAMAAAA